MDKIKHSGTIELQTERLCLRRFTAEDAQPLYVNYGSDSRVQAYINWFPCGTPEGTQEFLAMHRENYAKPDFYGWCIEAEGQPIGSIGVYDIDSTVNSCELGYSIGSRFWGNGYTTEAVQAVLQHLFETVGMNRVFAWYDERNTASGRVLEKCGFIQEGIARDAALGKDGQMYAVVYAAILRREWNQ